MRAQRALVAGLLLLSACADAATPPRNLILISLDTVGAKHLGCYGHERPTSPHLDAFAAGGVLFENAFAAAPWTLPSHGSLLTGLYPGRNGLRTAESALAEDVPTLAGVLSAHGYETAAFVNAIFVAGSFGLSRGFDLYDYIATDHSAEGAAREVTDRALAWLEEHRQRSVFVFIHYFDVHSDYRSQESFERMLGARRGHVDGTTQQLMRVVGGSFQLLPGDADVLERLYDAGIRQLDAELARLFARLEAGGWLESSLLVVTADHGEEFTEHGGVLHTRSHYDELLRVPLILRGGSLPAGLRVPTPVSLVDVAPTVLGLLGVPLGAPSDGQDLRPLWETPQSQPGERWIFSETGPTHLDDTQRSVRKGRYKLVLDLAAGAPELYDLVEDPLEQRNLAGERPEIVAELRAALDARAPLQRDVGRDRELSPETREQLRKLGYH